MWFVSPSVCVNHFPQIISSSNILKRLQVLRVSKKGYFKGDLKREPKRELNRELQRELREGPRESTHRAPKRVII